MATVEHPITRTDLREELDRTLKHYATKADLAQLEIRLYFRLGGLMAVFTGVIIAAQKFWI